LSQHSEYGITILRPEQPKDDSDTFKSRLPKIEETKDQARLKEVYSPPEVDHSIAKPVSLLVQDTVKRMGNDRLAELIAKASEKAKAAARTETKEERVSSYQSISSSKKTVCPIQYTDADRCSSDEEFIKRTMGGDVHSIELKSLFYANGGQSYIDGTGLLYAMAFDAMRREKLIAIRSKTKPVSIDSSEPWLRAGAPPKDSQVFVQGVPTVSELIARENAEADAKRREQSYKWLEQSRDQDERKKQRGKETSRDVDQEVHQTATRTQE
jgi:hypothetical protein